MRDYQDKIPSAIGAVDSTSYKINRTTRAVFPGHRHCHETHTKITRSIYNRATTVHVESGFLGHINDAQ